MATAKYSGKSVRNTLFVLLSLVFLCAAAGKGSIKNAETINVYTSETQSILSVESGIYIQSVNGLPLALGSLDRSPYFKYERTSWGALVIPPGRHIFDVKYSSGQGYSDIVTVEFTFKPGKAYRLYYNAERNEKRHGIIGTIQFFIEEKLQSDNEKEYLAFSGENPHYLEGVWFYSRNYPWEDITITFGGNNRFNTSSFNRRSKKTYTTEGVYFFNNDTIILYYENRQKKDFIEAQPPSVEKEILSYELTNGILRIISGGKAAIVTAGGLKGEYTK